MKIINVIASSLDGCIAAKNLENDRDRHSYHLTSKADQQFVREQVARADAIITGADSVRASKKLRPEKNDKGHFPHWYVLTTKGLDKNLEFWEQTQFKRTLVSPNGVALYDKSVNNLIYGKKNPAHAIFEDLKNQGAETVLLFGGGKINALFYKAGLVNELYLTLSPVIVGSANPARFIDTSEKLMALKTPQILTLQEVKKDESHLFLKYLVGK